MLGDILEASGLPGNLNQLSLPLLLLRWGLADLGLSLTDTVFFTALLATFPTPLNMIYLSVIH